MCDVECCVKEMVSLEQCFLAQFGMVARGSCPHFRTPHAPACLMLDNGHGYFLFLDDLIDK
jgi:hypothetical protein